MDTETCLLYCMLTYIDKYTHLVSIYADELKCTYFYLTEEHAP